MLKNSRGGGNTLSFLLAGVLALVTSGVWAADLYWKGGTGTEDKPADIYDPANWTTSPSYSGDSIASSPTASDKLNFKFCALTYLTNSMENADSAAVCSEVNFNGGNCVLLGAIRSASTFRLAQSAAVDVQIAEGGTLYAGGVLAIGCGKNATLTVNGGTVYSKDDLRVGNNSNSIAILNINGGIVEVGSSKTLALSSSGNGTVNLNGGMLKTIKIKKTSGTYGELNLNGGTLQANGDNDTDFIGTLDGSVNVLSGGGTIDANGHNVKITKSITGEGAMIFKGGGTITFSYNCNHTGGTTIELGTKVSMTANATTKILNNLVIDGRAVLENKTYEVFNKTSGLTEDAIKNITLLNCAAGSTVGFTSAKITVTLAAPTGVNTTTPVMAFEGKSLNEIKYANFTSRMFGNYANKYNAIDSAKGCNKKLYYDEDGNLSSIIVEFQAYDGSNIRCVVVEFTDGEGGVYAKALGARYVGNAPLGYVFLEQNKTTWHGDPKDVTTSYSGSHYGVCDFRFTQGDLSAMAWTLDEDKTWSALRNGATLASDEIVQILVTDADAVLTIDEDVNVGMIEFVNGSGATLSIRSGVTVSADSYSGLGFVLNNGIFQKWGEETVEMKFDDESTGVFVVNAGTLRAIDKRNSNTANAFTIDVKSGATYDVNGQTSIPASVRLAEGAHFISSADVANKAWGQTSQLILGGDADVTANGIFGLYKTGGSLLNLGSHTLTVNGTDDDEFMLCGTTITGDGTIYVASGRFCTRNAESTGVDCTLSIGARGKFENNMHLTVKNFVNNGTISSASNWGLGELEVTGRFESKAATIPAFTLTGATLKARMGVVVKVSKKFETSGTVTIDTSDITRADFDAIAENQRIPILTVPTEDKGGMWNVVNSSIGNVYAKWIDNGNNTSTLYICKPAGTMIIIR